MNHLCTVRGVNIVRNITLISYLTTIPGLAGLSTGPLDSLSYSLKQSSLGCQNLSLGGENAALQSENSTLNSTHNIDYWGQNGLFSSKNSSNNSLENILLEILDGAFLSNLLDTKNATQDIL